MNALKSPSVFITVLSLAVLFSSCTDNSAGPACCIPPPPEFNSRTAPGDSAQSFLEGDLYSTLNVEIDFMGNYEPTEDALDSLKVFLEAYLNKEKINIGVPNSIEAQSKNAYSSDDIRDIEETYRNNYTELGSDTLWAYILFVDGEFSDSDGGGSNVLGIAYYNTSTAYFGPTIHDNSRENGEIGTQPTRQKMEATVFNHEFGHIVGLVNNGTPMETEHQDTANGRHCTQEDCLMYYAVETTDFFANLFDGTIPDLQQYCKTDIQANGGK